MNTNASARKKAEPVGYEEVMAFVDYADRPGGLKQIRMPIHEVPPHCEALKRKRIEYGYSLKRGSVLLGLSPAELSGIEHGRLECSEREAQGFAGRFATAWMEGPL